MQSTRTDAMPFRTTRLLPAALIVLGMGGLLLTSTERSQAERPVLAKVADSVSYFPALYDNQATEPAPFVQPF